MARGEQIKESKNNIFIRDIVKNDDTTLQTADLTGKSEHCNANVQPVLVFETDTNDADSDVYRKTNTQEQFFWGEKKGSDFTNSLNEVYERIVFWRKNLFLLPSGSSGKRFIRETTQLIHSWIDATPIK